MSIREDGGGVEVGVLCTNVNTGGGGVLFTNVNIGGGGGWR